MPPLLAAEALTAGEGAAAGAKTSTSIANQAKGGGSPVSKPPTLHPEREQSPSLPAPRAQALQKLRQEGIGSSKRTSGEYTETMPMSRFIFMMSAATGFYCLQLGVGLMFMNPEILGGATGGVISASTCESALHLGSTLCAVVGAAIGAGSGVAIGAADTLTGGAISGASNALGEVLASFIGFAALVLFTLWYLSAGIPFFKGPRALKRFGAYACQAILGELPFIELAPVIPMSVFFVCLQARLEDKEQLAAMKAAAEQGQADEQMRERRAQAIQAVQAQAALPQGA